ncbi:hypothetical protein FOZ63_015566 [Perkinsus olseni]|uniref:Uncharacterized protein n=1 Tax=Perkinsus olseni TaxID=32597 RepID=A0A7J6Q9X2_PEROL|nr:hypothetical protein FOZ63_015566 [Perkinsus olseni]
MSTKQFIIATTAALAGIADAAELPPVNRALYSKTTNSVLCYYRHKRVEGQPDRDEHLEVLVGQGIKTRGAKCPASFGKQDEFRINFGYGDDNLLSKYQPLGSDWQLSGTFSFEGGPPEGTGKDPMGQKTIDSVTREALDGVYAAMKRGESKD